MGAGFLAASLKKKSEENSKYGYYKNIEDLSQSEKAKDYLLKFIAAAFLITCFAICIFMSVNAQHSQSVTSESYFKDSYIEGKWVDVTIYL